MKLPSALQNTKSMIGDRGDGYQRNHRVCLMRRLKWWALDPRKEKKKRL